MQGRSDTAGFIQAFTGSHRFVLDYLAGEVLERQPERVRKFLLQHRRSRPLEWLLCDAVTAQDGGKGMLESLSATTSLSSRSTTSVSGIAIITYSPMCCRRT